MKRSPLPRGGGLQRRTALKPKRSTPRRREAPRWGISEWADAQQVLDIRSGGRCEICGTDRGPFERHHRKRRRDGGESYQNLLWLCGFDGCHQYAHAHPAEARKFGWIVSMSRDPAEIPVLWRRREWMMLAGDGTMEPAFNESEPANRVGVAGPHGGWRENHQSTPAQPD